MLKLGTILEVLHRHDEWTCRAYGEKFQVFSQPFSPVQNFKASPQSVYGINHDAEDFPYYVYYREADKAKENDVDRFVMFPIAQLAVELINAANRYSMKKREEDYVIIDPMDCGFDIVAVMDYYYEVFYKQLPLVPEGSVGYGFIIEDEIGEIKCIEGIYKTDRYTRRSVLCDRCGAIKYETYEPSTIVGYEIVKKMIIDLWIKLFQEDLKEDPKVEG